MKQTILIIVIFSLIRFFSYGQNESWTLENCIQRAWDSNLTLQIEGNRTQGIAYNKRESLFGLLPNLNSTHRGNYNYGRSPEEDFGYTLDPTYNVSHSLNSSLVLFKGFSKVNFYRANIYFHKASENYYEYEKQRIALTVTQVWYALLLQNELVDVALERVNTANKQYEYIRSLVEVGRLEPASNLDAEASLAFAKLELQKVRNTYAQTALNLQQLLELDYNGDFQVSSGINAVQLPERKVPNIDSVYSLATEHFKSIKQLEFELKAQSFRYKGQKGQFLPTVSANAGLSSGYFKKASSSAMQSYADQINNKLNSYVGVNLTIPIFNGMSQNYSVKRSGLDLDNATLRLKKEKRTIYKEIENAVQQLEANYAAYMASVQNHNYSKKAFETMQERYSLGVVNITDLMLAEDRFLKAQVDLLSSKYEWIIQRKLIDYYTGN